MKLDQIKPLFHTLPDDDAMQIVMQTRHIRLTAARVVLAKVPAKLKTTSRKPKVGAAKTKATPAKPTITADILKQLLAEVNKEKDK